jgi:magnesium transporter
MAPHTPPPADANKGGVFAPSDTVEEIASPSDPEADEHALGEVQDLLQRYRDGFRPGPSGELEVSPRFDLTLEQALGNEHLALLKARLDEYHPADLAYLLEALPLNERLLVYELVDAERDGDILIEVTESVRETLLRSMDRAELVAAAQTLDTDDLAELAPDLPSDVVEQVRRNLSPEEREQLRAALAYPEDSVGARMDFEMVSSGPNETLDGVLRTLRRYDSLPDHTDLIFVVSEDDTLLGVLPLQRVLVNEPEAVVEDVMLKGTIRLQALDQVGAAAQAFERYDLVSAPVVDPHGRLVGRLTVAEMVDVIREEGGTDVLQAAGLREDEDLFASLWDSAKNRWLWLAVNLGTAFFASRVIGAFEGTIEKVVALAALMPIVAGIAGNSGNQTMTLFIRSLALGQANEANTKRLVMKELLIAGLNGLVWGTVAGLAAWFLYRDQPKGWLLGLTMTLAMVLNLLVGALIAMAVPLLLQKYKRDPALGSSVLLTFTTDSMGFFIFLGLATIFFK